MKATTDKHCIWLFSHSNYVSHIYDNSLVFLSFLSSLPPELILQFEKSPLPHNKTTTPRLSKPSSQALGREAVGGAPNIIIRGRIWSQSDRLSAFLLMLAPSPPDNKKRISAVVHNSDDNFRRTMSDILSNSKVPLLQAFLFKSNSTHFF